MSGALLATLCVCVQVGEAELVGLLEKISQQTQKATRVKVRLLL